MDQYKNQYLKYVQILEEELVVAMGCTEPIALAYAGAKCREILKSLPEKITVCVSGSILKNVKSVIVPNSGGMKGIRAAVAAGIVAGDAKKELEVISSVPKEKLADIRAFEKNADIQIECLNSGSTFDIIMEAFCGTDTVKLHMCLENL